MNDFYYLSHGGPGSGRYPLGSGDRPYQKYEQSKRKSFGISKYISDRKKAKAMETEMRRQKEKEFHDADKDRVLKSGTAKEVARYKGELTKQELQDVYSRLNFEKMINQISQAEQISNWKKVKDISSNVKEGIEVIAAAAVSYNTLASIYNNFVPEDRRLPVINVRRN